MKKKNIVGIIIIALFVIGIAAALMQYKKRTDSIGTARGWGRTGDSSIKCG